MPREKTESRQKRLEEQGLWQAYQAFIANLRNQGFGPHMAEKFAGLLFSVGTISELGNDFIRRVRLNTSDPDANLPNGMELVDADVWKDKRPVGLVEEIEWVRQHLAVAKVCAPDCPTAAAWTMLWDARSSADGYQSFMEKYATKLIPSRRELDAKLAQQDTHTKVTWIEHAIWAACNARAEAKAKQDAMDLEAFEKRQRTSEKARETRHKNKMRRLQEEQDANGTSEES